MPDFDAPAAPVVSDGASAWSCYDCVPPNLHVSAFYNFLSAALCVEGEAENKYRFDLLIACDLTEGAIPKAGTWKSNTGAMPPYCTPP